MRHLRLPFALLALAALLLPVLGCDSADNPIAPSGSVLTITANPTQISLNGSATLTVTGFKPDGNPLNPGTQINLSTTLGVLAQTLVEVAGGRATTTLGADGRSGTATITATLPGGGETSATVDVLVGQTAETQPTLSITASPNVIGIDESAEVTAIARNADGSLFGAGGQVNLRTDLGWLVGGAGATCGSSGASAVTVTTRANSEAQATLCGGDQPGSATITGSVDSSAEVIATVTIENQKPRLIVSANPDNIDANETSVITIFARDNNDLPLGAGLRIQLTATLGRLDPADPVTDSEGRAESMFTTDGDVGSASISAFLGSSDVVQTSVTLRDAVAVLSLQATPTDVERQSNVEQVINLVAIARNSQNDPVGGESLSFRTPFGRLDSGGSVVLTNNQGEATDQLRFSPDEAEDIPADVTSFEVTVTAGDISQTFTIQVVGG